MFIVYILPEIKSILNTMLLTPINMYKNKFTASLFIHHIPDQSNNYLIRKLGETEPKIKLIENIWPTFYFPLELPKDSKNDEIKIFGNSNYSLTLFYAFNKSLVSSEAWIHSVFIVNCIF